MVFYSGFPVLITVKMIILYIGRNPFFFKPSVVFFASVSCISRDIGRHLPILTSKYIQMLLQGIGINSILMKTVISLAR